MNVITQLQEFRQAIYKNLCKAQDATFELMDALLLTRKAESLADLSLSCVFRRQWSSVYEALQDTRPYRAELMKLYIQQIPQSKRIVLAGDHTSWSRPFAKTLKERTYEHSPSQLGGRPVTVGYGYSTLAWIPEAEGSWALPLLHERITSWDSPISQAVQQLSSVSSQLPSRALSLWDSEYGCAPFVNQTAGLPVDKLMRLRSNLCLWGAPDAYGGRGRPKVHGDRFKLNDSTTWSSPAQQVEAEDPELGKMRVRVWHNLHFRLSPDNSMSVLLVERLTKDGASAVSKPMWLAFVGLSMPTVTEVWRLYLRRFAIDHWYRFAKNRLHWTVPALSTPLQCDRWSDLMPIVTWQLWLARQLVAQRPLPWQKSQAKLTPGRVAQSFGSILALLGTPARPPKLRGKSPGWIRGRKRRPRIRYPTVKKGFSRPIKTATKSP
ncbi:NF041680 family putative transposase [Microcoleus sp. MOSTC5]|uniref:NF041680 family putative transposase n=1 Tax=Microcoleus sp. MOSTC5 TaxID=3055378 RepID=UPI002FD3F2E3